MIPYNFPFIPIHLLSLLYILGNVDHPRWRLVNGSTPAEGRLEYQLDNGTWVCVCTRHRNYSFVIFDKICSLLGFHREMTHFKFSSSLLYGRCLGPVYCLTPAPFDSILVTPSTEYTDCDESGTIGLRCINSKFISFNLSLL